MDLFDSTFRLAIPLLFAAMGGMICERSGIINLALEGMLLIGAFFAVAATLTFHSPWLGLAGGAFGGALIAALYAWSVINLRANQIVAATAVNLFALGITPFLCKILWGSMGSSPPVPVAERFTYEPMILACVIVVACHLLLYRTALGLWILFAGENPAALITAGVRVKKVRWLSVVASGVLAGMGGATLSIFLSSSFARNMSGGRGYMALAALIFGRWRPIPAAFACVLFGFTDAMQMRLQGAYWPGTENLIPVQFIQILPYVLTILMLALAGGRALAPKALGN